MRRPWLRLRCGNRLHGPDIAVQHAVANRVGERHVPVVARGMLRRFGLEAVQVVDQRLGDRVGAESRADVRSLGSRSLPWLVAWFCRTLFEAVSHVASTVPSTLLDGRRWKRSTLRHLARIERARACRLSEGRSGRPERLRMAGRVISADSPQLVERISLPPAKHGDRDEHQWHLCQKSEQRHCDRWMWRSQSEAPPRGLP